MRRPLYLPYGICITKRSSRSLGFISRLESRSRMKTGDRSGRLVPNQNHVAGHAQRRAVVVSIGYPIFGARFSQSLYNQPASGNKESGMLNEHGSTP